MYGTRSVLLNGTAQAVAASQTEQVVSAPFGLSTQDSLYFLAKLKCSALVAGTGVTFKLQHAAGDSVWTNVGSSAQAAAVQKTLALGTAEVTDLTWPATAAATQGDYVHITDQAGVTYAAWLDIDAAGTEPTGALYVAADHKITVPIVTGGSAADNAAAARAALVANATYAAAFTTSAVSTATFTITQVYGGAVTDPAPKSSDDGGAGSITVSVTTAGSNGTALVLATNVFTSAAHGYVTGDRVLVSSSGSLPPGLTTGEYWIIKASNDTFTLASSQAAALAGTAVDITQSYGTGTMRICQADYTVRLLATDSTDVAQLPLWAVGRWVVDTGSGDACTVSEIRITTRQ